MTPGSGLRIGRIFGIPIYLHSSWFIIFVLIAWSLATQFTALHPGWTPLQHWILGGATALLFFTSVLLHELGHSVVSLRYRIPVLSITLFVFGGLARVGREPASARQEFFIAVAGPVTSLLLALFFGGIYLAFPGNEFLHTACSWLGEMNFILAVFNLVPGFPLDGGRVLRAVTWGITGDFTRATKIASRGGELFAYLLMFLGVWQATTKNFVGGLWLVFIGWFLLSAARESYAQIAMRNTLGGLAAKDVMSTDVPAVPRDISIDEYIQEVLRVGCRFHVVTGNGIPVGLITLHRVREWPRDQWPGTSVQAAMVPLERIHAARADEPVLGILDRMQSEDVNQMPVFDDGRLIGIISRDSILRVLQTRLQLHHLAEQ
jgi:Zn-dependent protease/CBS domain-containing protein